MNASINPNVKNKDSMKEKIIEIISKHTPETTYVDGANAADEILALLDFLVSSSLKEDRLRIFDQLLINEEETAFSNRIIAHTDDVYNVLFRNGTIKP